MDLPYMGDAPSSVPMLQMEVINKTGSSGGRAEIKNSLNLTARINNPDQSLITLSVMSQK